MEAVRTEGEFQAETKDDGSKLRVVTGVKGDVVGSQG